MNGEKVVDELRRYAKAGRDCALAAEDAANSRAFEWLSERLVAAEFEWGEDKETVLIIAMPKGCAVSKSLRSCVERGMLSERLHQRSNG